MPTSSALIDAAVASWEADALMQGIDPRKLKPGEIVRLLNSSPLGPVITARQLDRHRDLAGFRIGDGRTLDFFRYVAWLYDQRHAPQTSTGPSPATSPGLSKQARYSRDKSSKDAEIGPIRPVVNPERRAACQRDLYKFLTTYFPHSTGRNPLSLDHERMIARLEHVIHNGGRLANGIYRGFMKTTISENAIIYAICNGHAHFAALFGATGPLAQDSLDAIKLEFETNELIDQDYPEITQAVQAIEGKPQRCRSQTHLGELTYILWTRKRLVFPRIPGSLASGAIITANGILAATRGIKHRTPDGSIDRPDLIVVDDPQTDASAAKPDPVRKRLTMLKNVILKLAGHNKRLGCAVNGTIIQKDDMMDQLTDPKKNPAFQRERIKMVKQWATAHDTHWLGKYAQLRTNYDPDAPDDQARAHAEADALYESEREVMDAGCEVSWTHCFDPEREISAIQHAYNLLIDDGPESFAAEFQGEPRTDDEVRVKPTLAGIGERINRLPRGTVPLWATRLVGFADVQATAIYYVVMALADDFTAAIVDYGTQPEQPREYFTLRDLPRTLQQDLAAANLKGTEGKPEAAIWHGLDLLQSRIIGRAWDGENKMQLRIERFLIDSGYATDTIYEWCRRSPLGAVVMPSKGHSIPCNRNPMTEWQIKPNERPGFHFVVTTDPHRRAVRLMKFDPYFWKTFVAARLLTRSHGSLSIFGESAERHKLLSDHLQAETPKWTKGESGREVWVWSEKPGQDNHWLDGVVGCYAAGAMQGCRLGENRPKDAAKRPAIPDHMIAGRAR